MLGYLSADIICSEKRTVFRERSSRKTVSYEEQIMPKDKYPSIFSPKMEAIVFIILQIFFATRAIFKIGEYWWIFPETKSRGISTNNHEPEANNCFIIITQVIIEIPKQRTVTIWPQFAIVDKNSYHAARINVSRNAFLNSRSEEKNIFFDVHTG